MQNTVAMVTIHWSVTLSIIKRRFEFRERVSFKAENFSSVQFRWAA